MRLLGTIFAGLLATPEAPRSVDPSLVACDEQAMERLEAHVAYLSREVVTLRAKLYSVEGSIERHDAAIGGLANLGRSVHIDSAGDLVLSGVNLRLLSATDAEAPPNGKGNLLLGHGTGAEQIEGSHNLIIGPNHTVAGRHGVILGSAHTTTGPYSVILGGIGSVAGQNGAVIGSLNSGAVGTTSVVIGGRDLWAYGPRTVMVAGQHAETMMADVVMIDGRLYRTE